MLEHVLAQHSLPASRIQAFDGGKVAVLRVLVVHLQLDPRDAAVLAVLADDQEAVDHVAHDREDGLELGDSQPLPAVGAVVAVGQPRLDADLTEDMSARTLQGVV